MDSTARWCDRVCKRACSRCASPIPSHNHWIFSHAEGQTGPIVLFSHIPLHHTESKLCGPLRERNLRRMICRIPCGVGHGWQKMLGKQTSAFTPRDSASYDRLQVTHLLTLHTCKLDFSVRVSESAWTTAIAAMSRTPNSSRSQSPSHQASHRLAHLTPGFLPLMTAMAMTSSSIAEEGAVSRLGICIYTV